NHLGFKLSASRGDEVALKDKTGRTVDSVSFGAATGQNTYARFPDGTGAFAWCAAPTPGASNGSACVAAPLPGGSGGAGGSTSGTGGAGAAGAGGGGGAGGLDGDGASLDSGL
ncbi:MAG: hypothetical protein JXP73_02525, partial [Deltaproteobacteria bacterium]|nr:hypothetical protein [Deltaproteobacteria bacterium]